MTLYPNQPRQTVEISENFMQVLSKLMNSLLAAIDNTPWIGGDWQLDVHFSEVETQVINLPAYEYSLVLKSDAGPTQS
jgi:hypothetical protein